MLSTLERRQAQSARIPFGILVALSHAHDDHQHDPDHDDAFEADAVDLSPGGLSLRSACLPEVGAQLLCSFETVPGGTRVSSRGEVVWTQLTGERSGEFGLRFLDIEPDARALIDEMVAERSSTGKPRTAGQTPDAPAAKLDLDGVGAPLDTRLMYAGGGAAVFEQRLDLLELGRGVVAHAGAALGRGNISDVALYMRGDVPVLSVTVSFEGGQSLFGEFDWDAKAAQDNGSDTARDLDAPALARRSTPADTAAPSDLTTLDAAASSEPRRASSVTMTEFRSSLDEPRVVDARASAQDEREHTADDADDADAQTSAELDDVPAALMGGAAQHEPSADDDDERRALYADEASDEDRPTIVRAASAARAEAQPVLHLDSHDETEQWAHPLPDSARASVLVRFLRIFAAIVATLQRGFGWAKTALGPTGARSLAASVAVAQRWRNAGWPRKAHHMGTELLAKLMARPRRVTAAPAALRKTQQSDRNVVRQAVMVALGLAALGVGAYALAPSADDDMIPVHRSVSVPPAAANTAAANSGSATTATTTTTATTATSAAATAPGATTTAIPAPVAQATMNPAYAQSMTNHAPTASAVEPAAAPEARPTTPSTVAGARGVPAGSPYAVDVHNSAPSAKADAARSKPVASSSTASFGAKSVSGARRFVLRMNAPVKALEGKAERDGFTVNVTGALAVDRAGPIKASHKSVARAAVLNKGDHSELTIRFVDGKHPIYRVSAHGAELEVLLGP